MRNFVGKKFLSPIQKLMHADVDLPQQKVIEIFLGLIFFIAIIDGTIMYFSGMQSYWSFFLLAGILLIGWLINRISHVKILPFFLVGAILAALQYNLYRGYGIHDVGIIAWPAVIFLCGLLFGSQMIPFATTMVILLAIVTRFVPNAQNFYGDSDTADLVLMLVVLAVFSVITWLMIWRNESSVQQLRQSEQRTQAIFNSVNDAIFILDVETGAILEVNHKMQEMYAYPRLEAIRLDFEMMSSGVPPYQQQNIREWLLKASAQGPQIFEWQAKDRNGKTFWVDISMKTAAIGGQSQAVVSVRDITERKQAEAAIHSLNVELEQRVAARTVALEAANKELNAFAYSVSHDLRAPLRTLNGFSNILMEDYQGKLDERGQKYLVRIQEASVHMGQLINDMLDLSRITRADFTRNQIDLSTLSREIAVELQMQDPQRKVEFEITDNLLVNGDPNLIRIVMTNLLNNAFKFTSHRDVANIQVAMAEQAGECVYFVRDNGAGFDMTYSAKLFTPFQRLHGNQEFPGTGIGLATVQRIISRHGGRIWAEGAVNQGAIFYFTLG